MEFHTSTHFAHIRLPAAPEGTVLGREFEMCFCRKGLRQLLHLTLLDLSVTIKKGSPHLLSNPDHWSRLLQPVWQPEPVSYNNSKCIMMMKYFLSDVNSRSASARALLPIAFFSSVSLFVSIPKNKGSTNRWHFTAQLPGINCRWHFSAQLSLFASIPQLLFVVIPKNRALLPGGIFQPSVTIRFNTHCAEHF